MSVSFGDFFSHPGEQLREAPSVFDMIHTLKIAAGRELKDARNP